MEYVVEDKFLAEVEMTLKDSKIKLQQFQDIIEACFYLDSEGNVQHGYRNAFEAYEYRELIKKILKGESF